MNWTSFSRYEAKMRAKASMHGTRPSALLVTVVYLLLTTGVTLLVGRLVFNPSDLFLEYLSMDYAPEEILLYMAENYMPQMLGAAAVSFVLGLYGTILVFGYDSYALRLSRDEMPSYGNLFDGFLKVGRVLWMNILRELFVLLWALPLLILAVVFLIWAVVAKSELMVILSTVAHLGAAVVVMVKSYSYRMAPYFMLDDPSCTARESITRSKLVMAGHKGELFMLDLSFLGWMILAGLTMGLLMIWLQPYMAVTEANFYNFVTQPFLEEDPGEDDPSGGPKLF